MLLPGFLTVRDVDPHHLKRYLLPREESAFAIRRHPAMLLRPVGETLGGLILAGALSAVLPRAGLTVIWVGWLLVAGRLAYKVFEWSDGFFTVTGLRVLLVHGTFTRRVDMVPLARITDLSVNRSLAGRMLGYGTIVMESEGQDQAVSKVEYIPEPESVYLEISAGAFGDGDD